MRRIATIDFASALSDFPAAAAARLRDLHQAPDFAGVIAAADAREVAERAGLTVEVLMTRLVGAAALFAKPPVSDFFVGAVSRGITTGNLYYGANLEFAGESLAFAVHAEQSSVTNAWMSGEAGVDAIAVSAAPCGHCRQFLNELTTAQEIVIALPGGTYSLEALLPSAFGPRDLYGGARLMDRGHRGLAGDESDELASAALGAANMSHAPYSGSYAGVALRAADGSVFAGAYAENAAFNPSISPLQVALSRMNLAGRAFDEIAEAVLVHVDATHVNATRTVLAVITSAPLRLVHARNSASPDRR